MIKKSFYSTVLLSHLLCADNIYNTMSLQGTIGVINTPTAEIIDDGLVELQYSNQVDIESTREHYSADHYFVKRNWGQVLGIILY